MASSMSGRHGSALWKGAAHGTGPSTSKAMAEEANAIRERRNWLIHQLYIRQEYIDCLSVVESQLRETEGKCQYSLYVKGLLKRMDGELTESLNLFLAASLVSSENATTRKQLGRAYLLLGRHRNAIEAFTEAENLRTVKALAPDWEIPHSIGVCYAYMKQHTEAQEAFLRSLSIQRHAATFKQLGKILVIQGNIQSAMEVYEESLRAFPDDPELLGIIGQLHIRLDNTRQALDYLDRCIQHDPKHPAATIAAASLTQDAGRYDAALDKYRGIVSYVPNSPQLWNNIGVCYFGKRNHYAAVACLRKSIFIYSLEWITNYNLGIVYLSMGRYASAFQYLSAAISLHNSYAPAYMYLGVSLSLLNDTDNACHAYEKALSIEDDFLCRLNYAVTLWNCDLVEQSRSQFELFNTVWKGLTVEQREEQYAIIPQVATHLETCLGTAGHLTADSPGAEVSPTGATTSET